MESTAGWIAPIATMVAAMMTAANLGARVTGWGFLVFTIGSVCWSLVGAATGQSNLLWTNVFLTLINAVGIWRWLGRQAKYDDGGQVAALRSAAARVPTLFSTSAIIGQKLLDAQGQAIGSVVDSMARCRDVQLAYIVVSEGGLAGVGERLHALDPAELLFTDDGVKCRLMLDDLKALPVLEPGRWPAMLEARSHSVADPQTSVTSP